jgi:hypothetical protein
MTSRIGGRRPIPWVCALAWVVLSGCGGNSDGPPTVPVSGSLAIDGKPVAKGSVHFHPATGRPATGIVQDGRFTLTTYQDRDGGIAGINKVAVEVVEEVPLKGGDTASKSLIAAKYASPDESGIEVEIPAAGYKNLQIDIKAKGGVAIKEE